jgi:hypothetical protein
VSQHRQKLEPPQRSTSDCQFCQQLQWVEHVVRGLQWWIYFVGVRSLPQTVEASQLLLHIFISVLVIKWKLQRRQETQQTDFMKIGSSILKWILKWPIIEKTNCLSLNGESKRHSCTTKRTETIHCHEISRSIANMKMHIIEAIDLVFLFFFVCVKICVVRLWPGKILSYKTPNANKFDESLGSVTFVTIEWKQMSTINSNWRLKVGNKMC